MKQIVRDTKIIGTGSYVPEKVLTNDDLAAMVATSDEWIYNKLGIRERHVVHPGQCTSDLAVEAGKRAIENAGITKDQIDLIIVATATADRRAPSTACIVQDKLQAYNAAAFDVTAVCAGFIYAFIVGSQFIAAGTCNNVLVIGADTFSTITDFTRRDCVFFGDGAGAAVLSRCRKEENESLLAYAFHADGRGRNGFTVPGGGSELPLSQEVLEKHLQYFVMDGHAVFQSATTVIPDVTHEVLEMAGYTVNDIDVVVPHQPSINVLKVSAEKLGIPFHKVLHNMEKYANTSGATIPLLLDEAHRNGRIRPGNLVLFVAVGSGWTWGAALLRWI